MLPLQLLAGPEAEARIRREGLLPELFDKVIAASGGPKWLPLAALDRHLLYRFFPTDHPLSLLGTSSGAWRCATLSDPEDDQAHRRLQQGYIHQRYERPPTPAEVDAVCEALLAAAVGDRAHAITSNPHRRLNIIVCRGRHLNGRRHRAAQGAGLAVTALTNLLSRRSLDWHWRRCLMSAQPDSPFSGMTDLASVQGLLDADNLLPTLLATGSIPLVLSGVTGLPGMAPGRYFDGGVTDYHLDLPALKGGGLTLYPHFYPHAAPGWFDKNLRWRRARDNFNKVVILTPSPAFIATLPGGKLPDRTDFSAYDSDTRIRHWERAVALGEALVPALEELRADPLAHLRSL
ncbi:alpha/beta hydrolase [Ferrimonas balearica]|uniref:alpha/beta hydrolase n=1 Tax=Ferrimonas balearica TaxID=44012 RepID=UPI001C99AFB1|nr:alpha/beta hydrolase [Ferrimonas balearica]MBY5992255.1 alpha/beta hydrolase [Ferrimonas balearica]